MKARAKSRRKKQQQVERPEWGIVSFLLAAFFLAGVAYFLRDYKQLQYGLLGSYVWIIALSAFFFAFLAYFAQFILPLSGETGWYEGLRLLATYFMNAPLKKMRPSSLGAVPAQTPISPSFETLKAGIVESQYALALARNSAFTRAVGPGYVSLHRKEYIAFIVDLRRHLRSQRVKAMTRDGIPLETSVTVIFRIKPPPAGHAPSEEQYPYDSDAIFRVSYLGSINNGEEQQHWSERVCPHAAAVAVDTLSRYPLDELLPPNHTETEPAINGAKKELHRKLTDFFEPYGIDIVMATIGRFDLPEDIVQQRINNWQSDWQRRIHVQEASANAEAIRRLKNARARAQVEMIVRITNSIEAMRQEGHADLVEVITLHMLDAMEEAIADDAVQVLTPRHVITNLAQMRHWLDPEGQRRLNP